MESIAKGLHDGTIKPEKLSKEAILKTYQELNDGAADGYDKNWNNFNQDQESLKTVQSLKKNIYLFSGAKTYSMQQEMNNLLHADGKIKPFNDFKNDVLKINPTYNKTYLQAEFQTARATANHVRNWQQFQANKDIFPNLQYKTVGDARVRDAHQQLNDVIKPINDPFWNNFYPPNGWRCRCYVTQTADTITTGKFTEPLKYGVDAAFQNNAAKSGSIYNNNKHPYFALAKAGGKKVASEMELSKNNAPYETAYTAQNGSKVKVNPFADTNDLKGNYEAAVRISEGLGLNVKIRPHLDGHIIQQKNPEFEINGKLADRKTPEGTKIKRVFRKASKQGVETVVLDLSKTELNIETAKIQLKNIFRNANNHPDIKNVIIISKDGNTVEKHSRKELIK